jgi:hypothetical protein
MIWIVKNAVRLKVKAAKCLSAAKELIAALLQKRVAKTAAAMEFVKEGMIGLLPTNYNGRLLTIA